MTFYARGIFGQPVLGSSLQSSLSNLGATLDPRDQMAHDLRSGIVTGGMFETRMSQIDPRSQEAYDIRNGLAGWQNDLVGFGGGKLW